MLNVTMYQSMVYQLLLHHITLKNNLFMIASCYYIMFICDQCYAISYHISSNLYEVPLQYNFLISSSEHLLTLRLIHPLACLCSWTDCKSIMVGRKKIIPLKNSTFLLKNVDAKECRLVLIKHFVINTFMDTISDDKKTSYIIVFSSKKKQFQITNKRRTLV